ncbi:MAG: 3-isopropylmalate dehydratase small subunit [Thiotrichales bacterium]|mgnify:CR=1 FL=1|nr:3-isopropylmalate dehydratase small subunit [Thiotrichales bacterium]
MEPFASFTGVAAPLDSVDVDTDQIAPTRFLLKPRAEGDYGAHLLHDLRYDERGEERAAFILNQKPFRRAEILVANDNFGSGSSREQAAWCCADFGFKVIIAPSLGDIFKANCAKLGVVPAIVDGEALERLRQLLHQSPGTEVTVDLVERRVLGPGNWNEPFDIEDYFRSRLLQGMDDFDLSNKHTQRMSDFQQDYRDRFPWS